MNQTFEQFSNLKARDSFDKLCKKVVVERPQLVRFRGKAYQVVESKGNNVLLVRSLHRSQKCLVHEFELDI